MSKCSDLVHPFNAARQLPARLPRFPTEKGTMTDYNPKSQRTFLTPANPAALGNGRALRWGAHKGFRGLEPCTAALLHLCDSQLSAVDKLRCETFREHLNQLTDIFSTGAR